MLGSVQMLEGANLPGSKNNSLGPLAPAWVCAANHPHSLWLQEVVTQLEVCACLVPDSAWGVERRENE